MKKSYIFFVLILTNLFGQSFTGLVKDISGEPIPYVIVEEINSKIEEKNWAISDENGVFTKETSWDVLVPDKLIAKVKRFIKEST